MHRAGRLGRRAAKVSHDEDHIKLANPSPNEYVLNEYNDDNTSRWHHFFPKFETQMLSLIKFVYTHEGWPNLFDMWQAFDERDWLVSSFQLERYVSFNWRHCFVSVGRQT